MNCKPQAVCSVLLLCLAVTVKAQTTTQTNAEREYSILLGVADEQQIYASVGLTANRILYDLYYQSIANHVPAKLQGFVETVWSINATFLCTMWPHDGGHWCRAQQAGGNFVITQFGYPFPVAEMHLSDDVAKHKNTLASIGGHEINYLMRRQVHMDYYVHQTAFADELIHAFIQDIFYPLYAFVITPADPEEASYWTDTRGDPVESVLSIFETFENRVAVAQDGTVDPVLVDQYREAICLSLIWPLLNPLFYQSLTAFNADMQANYGQMPAPKMYGKGALTWSWGTHFHPSNLGYELYLDHYLRFREKLYVLSLKTGRPYRNNGFSIALPQLLISETFLLGLQIDYWDQDIYGTGGGLVFDARYNQPETFSFLLRTGWKTDGYQPGRRVDESLLFLAGFVYRF